jgi:hypothetical protein
MIELTSLFSDIVSVPALHARFLNSLSLMENTGARKIAASEQPGTTDITLLKHAAEEFRHAYYLKKQIAKVSDGDYTHYHAHQLMAPIVSRQYLHRLDVTVCRMLKERWKMSHEQALQGAYLLVTYAIEVRADELYGQYQAVLTAVGSKVNVKSIIVEEEGHLAEMKALLSAFHAQWETMAEAACAAEQALFTEWLQALHAEVVAEHAAA